MRFNKICVEADGESQKFSQEMLDLLSSFELNISRLHLRFEDDYYAEPGKPYSFGFLIDSLRFFNVTNAANLVDKRMEVRGARMYWNSMSEMYIPQTLWESTKDLKYQIFEAMDASSLA